MGIKEVPTKLFISEEVSAVYNPATTIAMCRKPYPDHPNGCPNWGKKDGCPPRAVNFIQSYQPEVRIVAVELNMQEYDQVRKAERPDLPKGQRLNQRIWQPNLNRRLRDAAQEALLPGEILCLNPEATGVDVTETCKLAGLELEWPKKGEERTKVNKVALLVKPKEDFKPQE